MYKCLNHPAFILSENHLKASLLLEKVHVAFLKPHRDFGFICSNRAALVCISVGEKQLHTSSLKEEQ